jgi:TonB-dependent starch-binding outer membrane protein SusC
MRKFVLLLFLFMVWTGLSIAKAQTAVYASSLSQHQKNYGNLQTIELKHVLSKLEEKYKISFLYDASLNDVGVSGNIDPEISSVDLQLDNILRGTALIYKKLEEGFYVILKKDQKVNNPLPDNGANQKSGSVGPANRNTEEFMRESSDVFTRHEITGRVVSTDGENLPGVNVVEKGTTNGTATDADGKYVITVSDPLSILVFSFIGFATQEVSIGGRTVIDIGLTPDISSLDEVVVVGYGTQKKSDLTGSISKVKDGEIKAIPVVALDRAMQGRAAGVLVTASSARPGGGSTIRIRGTGSVNAGNEPLYVIDGYPIGDLNSINPNDIESMEILKDASATAIYGSRGSNGVVIVTTKRGKTDQAAVEFDSFYGVQSVRRKIPLLNSQDYARFVNEARINGGGTAFFDGSAADRPLPEDITQNTDWQQEILREAPIQSYQLSLSGGENKTRYAISGSYFDQQGIVLNSEFKRYTLRANLDREISRKLTVGLSMQGAYTNSNSARTETDGGGASGVTNAALNFAPIFPVYNADGSYNRYQGALNGNLVDNPVGLANEITDQFNVFRLLANTYFDLKIMEGLNLRSTFGADLNNGKTNFYATRKIGLGASTNGSASISAFQNLNWLNENTLTYTKKIAQDHSLLALVGYTIQGYRNENFTARAANFSNDFGEYNNLGGGATLQSPSSGIGEWALISYLARVNYDFKNRYLLTVTARRDGSSRFGTNNKFGFFPSAALAWKIANESFLKNQRIFSDLKLRVSYGLSGNQEIGDYRYFSTITNASAALGNPSALNIGGAPNGIGNLDLKWETNAQFDIGLDASFLNNRVQLTADVYRKVTSDLLFSVNVPVTSGYTNSLQNIGEVENKGLELELKTINIDRGGFQWTSEFNIAFNENKILTLDGRPEFTAGEGSGHLQVFNTVLLKVGDPLSNFYGRQVEGIFQTADEIAASAQPTARPGDLKYKDITGDNIINDSDRTVLGNGLPKSFGGFNNTFTYRGVELNIFMQGSFGNSILNFGRFDLYNLNGGNNQSEDVLNRWTPTNTNTDIPRANSTGGQRILSSFHIEDGSYLRIRNISLGYTLPATLTERAYIKKAKIYVAAQNWITFTNYKGFDPEVSRFGTSSISQGMDYGGYPTAKTILVGLNLKF